MDKRALMLLFAMMLNGNYAYSQEENIEQILRSGPEVNINEKEQKTLSEIKRIKNAASGPISQPDGSVLYTFGEGIPTLLCRFMTSCEILLDKEEYIESSNIAASDKRIVFKPLISKEGEESRTVILVTPVIDGIISNLHFLTNKRNYIITVKSTKRESYPRISFVYQDSAEEALEKYKEEVKNIKRLDGYTYKESYKGQFKIEGDAEWMPTRAFFNGKKTVVEFKKEFSLHERPTLHRLVGDKRELVDYRVVNNKYIVDYKLDQGVLSLEDTRVLLTNKDFKPPLPVIKATASFISDEF